MYVCMYTYVSASNMLGDDRKRCFHVLNLSTKNLLIARTAQDIVHITVPRCRLPAVANEAPKKT